MRLLCPHLIGRDDELQQLDAAIESARRGEGRLIVVMGAAGIGKSRLASAAADDARGKGIAVLSGRCVPSGVAVPYRPIAEALIAGASETLPSRAPALGGFGPALGWIVPAWREEGETTPESPVVVAEALLRALTLIGGAHGCVVVIEDLHWADSETIHALQYVADHVARFPVACIATCRDDPGTAAHSFVSRLDVTRRAERIQLNALNTEEADQMVSEMLGVGRPDARITALTALAEGSPLLVEELLSAAASDGVLVRDADTWRLSERFSAVLPQSFSATVAARLERLGPAGRRFLATAAMLGRTFDWRIVAASVECDTTSAHALLEQAVSLQLLSPRDDTFAFRHALTRDAILARLLPTERAELAASCLQVMEAAGLHDESSRAIAAELAQLCGDRDHAARLFLELGRASRHRAALDSATSALQRGVDLAIDRTLRADALEALAETRSAAGDLRATQAAVSALLDELAHVRASPERRGSAHLLVARCAVGATEFDLASEELAHAREAAGTEQTELTARTTAVAAELALGQGRANEAEALALRAADIGAATDLPAVMCEALEVAGRCARMRNLEEAHDIGVRMLRVAEAAGLAFWRMRALYQTGVVEMFRHGRIDVLRRARDEAERLGAVATACHLDLEIAAGLEAMFRLDECREVCMRCIDTAHALEMRTVEALVHAFVAIIEAEHGSRAAMEQAIVRSLRLAGNNRDISGAVWGDARAIASLAAEDRSRARRELEQAVVTFDTSVAVVPRLATALLPLVVAVDGDEPDFARADGATLSNSQALGYLAFAEAIVKGRSGLRAEAEAAAARGDAHLAHMPWYRRLMHRLAAEPAINDGWGDPEAWLTDAAAFFDASDNQRLAAACRGLLRRTGGRVARPTRASRTLPRELQAAGVTPREADVLDLVGEGLSNRAIAERLFLSERTVEQHVGVLKQKLGARSRAQLAVAAASTTPAR